MVLNKIFKDERWLVKKKYALIADIHGNIYGLNAVLNDIKKRNVDDIYCLWDTIDIGPDSKECVDKLIELNVKTILGNHELYLLRGTEIEPSIVGEEKEHYKRVKNSLGNKEIGFLKSCPLYFELGTNIPNKKIILCHYFIKDEKLRQPFEENHLKRNPNLLVKYNDPNILYIIGHLHKSFDLNEIYGTSKINKLVNIEIVDSAGCSYDEYVSYMILEIGKSVKCTKVKVKFNRDEFIDKVERTDFPDKVNIMKIFYGIDKTNL